MEHPGSQDMREAIERLANAMDKSRKELEGLARRDVALRARYRTSVARVAERAIPDLRRRTLEQLLTEHRLFVDDAVLAVFARNSVMARILNTRRYAASVASLRDIFCDYIGRSGASPFASARAEIAAIEVLMVRARAEDADAAGVLAGMRSVLANDIQIPDELVADIRLVCRPRSRKSASVTVSTESNTSGVASELSGIPNAVRQFALSVAVA